MDAASLISQLLAALPDFHPADEDLPSVVCDQAVDFLARRSREEDQATFHRDLRGALEVFEAAARSVDVIVHELVLVDFIELLHLFGPRCREVAATMGPNLQAVRAEWERTYQRSMGPLCPDEVTSAPVVGGD